MKAYPWRPFLVPAFLGLVTGFGLLAALLSDGPLEIVAVVGLACVVGVVIACLFRPQKRR